MTKRSIPLGLMLVGMIAIVSFGVRVISTEAESEYSNGTYFVYLPVILNSAPSCDSMPTLLSPADESNLDTLIPLFTIDPSGNPQATEFVLEISSDPDFNFVQHTLYSGIYTPFEYMLHRNLDPATTYYWRARHICDGVDGPYTETWSLTAGSGGVILPAPNLITPANGSTLTSLPETFEWTSVTGGIEYLHAMFEGGITYYSWRTGTQVDLGWFDPDTTFDWWVAARNAYAIGDDSDIWQFTTPSGTLSPFQEDQTQLRIYSDGDEIVIIR